MDADEDRRNSLVEVLAGFRDYRSYCDKYTDGFRKTGILTEDSYRRASVDQRTVLATADGGRFRFPGLVAIDLADRYAAQRCKQLTGREDTFLCALPLGTEADWSLGIRRTDSPRVPTGASVVFESLAAGNASRAGVLRKHEAMARVAGQGPFSLHEFSDPRLMDFPDNQSAWMAIYGVGFCSPSPPNCEETNPTVRVTAAWSTFRERHGMEDVNLGTFTGSYLLPSTMLADRPDLIDSLWSVSQVGFGDILGAHHPMDMAVGYDHFLGEILREDSFTVAYFRDGVVECFGFLDFSLQGANWLNQRSNALEGVHRIALTQDQVVVHFHELIARGESGAGYGVEVLRLFFDLAAIMGGNYLALFESTNLSSLYIPRIAERAIVSQEMLRFTSPVEEIERLNYWFGLL